MNTRYEREQAISDWLMAAQDNIRESIRRQNAEIRARNAKLVQDYEANEAYMHVFYDYANARVFLMPNKVSEIKGILDFRWYVRHERLYYHCIVRGRTRANIVASWLKANVAVWRDVPGLNVIELALGEKQS